MSLPFWARKPKHKRGVIATDKGWVVKDTGEILKSVRNLKSMLAEIAGVAEAETVVNVDPQTSVTTQPTANVEDKAPSKTRVQEFIDKLEPNVPVVEEKAEEKPKRKYTRKTDTKAKTGDKPKRKYNRRKPAASK